MAVSQAPDTALEAPDMVRYLLLDDITCGGKQALAGPLMRCLFFFFFFRTDEEGFLLD
jgi:hypothetical protein